MPLTDQEKSTVVLLQEIHAAFSSPTIKAKIEEVQFREIKSGDNDDIVIGGTPMTRGGSRPNHQPLNP